MTNRLPLLGLAALIVMVAMAGLWIFQSSGPHDARADASPVVVLRSADTASAAAAPITTPAPAATAPTASAALVAQVRQAYPLLTDVAFVCDGRSCAITATIPPPTGEAFLAKRQEMLLGGLAKVAEANGYKVLGPVQMDEIDDNLFHIREAVAPPR
jgi:hypothetical protein